MPLALLLQGLLPGNGIAIQEMVEFISTPGGLDILTDQPIYQQSYFDN